MSTESPENTAPVELPLEQTSISDIKARLKKISDGKLIRLPVSGMVFRLGKPSISKLLKTDAIPADLVVEAIKLDTNRSEPKNKAEYLKTLQIIDRVVCEAGIAPKIVMTQEEVDDNSIWIEDLDDQDRITIYLYAQSGVTPEIKSFREERTDRDAGSNMSEISE